MIASWWRNRYKRNASMAGITSITKEKRSLYLFVLTGLSTLDIIRIVKEAQYGRRKSAMPSVEVAPVQEI